MTDAEIAELKERKRELTTYYLKLQKRKQDEEAVPRRKIDVPPDFLSQLANEPNKKNDDGPSLKKKKMVRLNDLSQSMLGVQFKHVQKNWVNNDVYRLDAEVVTKALQFSLELAVNIKDPPKYKIEDINCHFLKLDECFIAEIAPWTLRFTREKNFSMLISAVSEYSEVSMVRANILRTLESRKYVSMEKSDEESGGILANVHPPWADDKTLFQFHWYTKFVDKTWRVEHIFIINPVDADENFVEDTADLLQGFCKIGLKKAELEKLWSDLCSDIDELK